MYLSQEITSNLQSLDETLVADQKVWDYANSLLETSDIKTTARILGFDIKDYDRMLVAGQLLMIDLVKRVPATVADYIKKTRDTLNKRTLGFLVANVTKIDALLKMYSWTDYRYDYLSASSMIKLYLSRHTYQGEPYEKPSTLFMRYCAQVCKNYDQFNESFIALCLGKYTPASAGLFNAGKLKPQMASCFLTKIGDSRLHIYSGLAKAGEISAGKGGMGITVTPVRHSEISDASMSKGLVPMSRLYDGIIDYSKQGRARNGALTLFVVPWHIDIQEFILALDQNIGKEDDHINHSDICIWMPWVFWDRVREDKHWTLFCPKYVKHLQSLSCHEFTREYEHAESDPNIPDRYKVRIQARDLLHQISTMWQKKGKPFIMNGDSANFKSNHKHIGYIPGSNLCLEIVEYIDEETINVCNLSSLSLSFFAKRSKNPTWDSILKNFNFDSLSDVVRLCVRNINSMIDINYSPLEELYKYWNSNNEDPIIVANRKYRSLGIGVQGLGTLFQKLDLCYSDELAVKLDETIFACMYFNAITESIQEAIIHGVCEAYHGSPLSQGKFQFDLWREEWEVRWDGKGCRAVPNDSYFKPVDPKVWGQKNITLINPEFGVAYAIEPSWESLREAIVLYGVRNSLLLALMPTMSSSKPLRNSDTVEVYSSNLYATDVVYGSYPFINYHMVKDFKDIGLWSDEFVNHLIINNGDLHEIHEFFPNVDSDTINHLKAKYLTMFDIKPSEVKRRAFLRNKYICQSSSSNVFIRDANAKKLEALFMIDGEYGNKTVQYYLYQHSQVRNVTLAKVETITKNVCVDGLCCT